MKAKETQKGNQGTRHKYKKKINEKKSLLALAKEIKQNKTG